MPNFNHHTASCESCAGPVVANGDPLSVRSARGSPYSQNVRSNHGRTPLAVGATIRQQNTNRLHASAIVSGSHRVPSAVRNQPLKSAVHTSFGAVAATNGCVSGTVYRVR